MYYIYLTISNHINVAYIQCSGPCEVGVRRRSVSCQDNSGHFQHDKYCNQTSRPLAIEACGDKNTCLPVWVPQEWGVVSVFFIVHNIYTLKNTRAHISEHIRIFIWY